MPVLLGYTHTDLSWYYVIAYPTLEGDDEQFSIHRRFKKEQVVLGTTRKRRKEKALKTKLGLYCTGIKDADAN